MYIVIKDEDGAEIQLEIDLDDFPNFDAVIHVDALEASIENWLETNFGD